jgi:hypothetical protein
VDVNQDISEKNFTADASKSQKTILIPEVTQNFEKPKNEPQEHPHTAVDQDFMQKNSTGYQAQIPDQASNHEHDQY